jgi:hypothetical protein
MALFFGFFPPIVTRFGIERASMVGIISKL